MFSVLGFTFILCLMLKFSLNIFRSWTCEWFSVIMTHCKCDWRLRWRREWLSQTCYLLLTMASKRAKERTSAFLMLCANTHNAFSEFCCWPILNTLCYLFCCLKTTWVSIFPDSQGFDSSCVVSGESILQSPMVQMSSGRIVRRKGTSWPTSSR
jgi:hypothetical protein